MDEHGVPKYSGRKRGRKPKPRQRRASRRKRQHTAYTLFVQEHHAAIRAQDPERPSSEIISMIAKQWAQVSAEEKKLWKQRALATHTEEEEERPVYQHHGRDEEQVIYDDEEEVDEEEEEDDEVDENGEDDEEDEEGSDSPARRMPRR